MFFTVYTPTYNRAHLLNRVYDSLLAQDDRDFEWLIVDDGSTDDTEAVIKHWLDAAPFPVRYIRQTNQGKHIATNRAVELAAGEMFVIVDSDDWLAKGALRTLHEAWNAIPNDLQPRIANIAGLFLDTTEKPVTRLFPSDAFDCSSVDMEFRFGITGEIAMATRTDVRRQYPFPENVGRYCMPSLVWNRIATKYLTRYLNQPIQYKEYQQQGITLSGVHRKLRLSPESFRIRNRELLELPFKLPGKTRTKAMRMYIRASLHAGHSLGEQWQDCHFKSLWLSQVFKGWRDYRKDIRLLADAS